MFETMFQLMADKYTDEWKSRCCKFQQNQPNEIIGNAIQKQLFKPQSLMLMKFLPQVGIMRKTKKTTTFDLHIWSGYENTDLGISKNRLFRNLIDL